MKKILRNAGIALLALAALVACDDAASVASRNLSQSASNFGVERRIVFYNGITDSYILVVEGKCSLDIGTSLKVTCKVGPDEYKKHYLGLSDNVTYFAEQIDAIDVSEYHYKVVFRPQSVIPDVDFKGSTTDVPVSDNG
jgi:hypothetical protein